jgi:hypothetical protein
MLQLVASTLLAAGVVGCGMLSSGGAPPDPVASQLAKAVADRTARGLRADEAYVLHVLQDPASLERDGIRVTADEAIALDEAAINKAIALRDGLGLMSDKRWVRALQADPTAVDRLGVRMSPEEAALFDRRIDAQLEVGDAVVAYGEAFSEEWGGAYIDETTATVVASFTGHLADHDASLHALVDPRIGSVRVRAVRFSMHELETRNAGLWSDEAQAWLRDLGIRVVGGGARVVENDVRLEGTMERFEPSAAQAVIDRFEGADWLRVDIAPAPPRPSAFGGLVVHVVNAAGLPLEGVRCWAHPAIPGFAGDEEVQESDHRGLCTWLRLGATAYEVDLWHRAGEGVPFGSAHVEVREGRTAEATIRAVLP